MFSIAGGVKLLSDTTSSKAYDAAKGLIFTLTPNRTSSALSYSELATAGFLSAVPTTVVTAPVERAKVLLQVCRDFVLKGGQSNTAILRRSKVRVDQASSTLVSWTS